MLIWNNWRQYTKNPDDVDMRGLSPPVARRDDGMVIFGQNGHNSF